MGRGWTDHRENRLFKIYVLQFGSLYVLIVLIAEKELI